MSNCHMCGKILDNPIDALSGDCGGDCLLCMAECDDPACFDSVKEIVAAGKPTLDTETARIQNLVGPKTNERPEYKGDSLRRFMYHYD